MDNRLTTAENFAASQVLTEWPDDMTYDQLLDGIAFAHPDVIIWDQFEDELPADIIDTIENLRITFMASVAHMTEDLRQAIKDGDQQAIADRMLSLENQLGV